jgi:hypothetical protein
MSSELLTATLAQKVMRWGVAPDRFLMDRRRWMPRWRFQPSEKLQDAFRLLEAADPEEFSIDARGRTCTVSVQIGGTVGEASDTSKARAITHAVARAVGLEPEAFRPPKPRVGRQ